MHKYIFRSITCILFFILLGPKAIKQIYEGFFVLFLTNLFIELGGGGGGDTDFRMLRKLGTDFAVIIVNIDLRSGYNIHTTNKHNYMVEYHTFY